MKTMYVVVLPLPKCLVEKLQEVLSKAVDCGPSHEGWKSPELTALESAVSRAVKKADVIHQWRL